MSKKHLFKVAAAFFISLFASNSTYAKLGGEQFVPSSDDPKVSVQTTLGSVPSTGQSYIIVTTTLGSGSKIIEYLDITGTVFGEAWNGPTPPDLEGLLGSYIHQYQDAANIRANTPGRPRGGALQINSGNLVLTDGGHMGSYIGHAWIPSMLPPGFNPDKFDF
ncbi:DUF2844 domain-containing protein [Burkholderia gladioli]